MGLERRSRKVGRGIMVRRHLEMMLMGWHGVWTYKVMGRKKTMRMVKIGRDLTWLQK
jgi:hypothetical protein